MRATAACAAALLVAGWVAREARPEDAPTEEVTLATLRAAVATARKATRGDKAAVGPLAAAVESLSKDADRVRRQVKEVPADVSLHLAFAAAWNDAVTALRWHGASGVPAYVLTTAQTFRKAGLSLGYPLGARWSVSYTGKNDQHILTLVQRAPSGQPLCEVKVWTYSWDVVYSGVGGENYVKLARIMLELEREVMAGPGSKSSPSVTAKSLNAQFPRTQFYFVEGYDDEVKARVKRLNYYLKDDQRTYNVEFVVRVEAAPEEDAISAWQRSDADPERQAVLQALSSVVKKGK
jgi:hypothetical protein